MLRSTFGNKKMRTRMQIVILFVSLLAFVGCGTTPSDPRAKAETGHGLSLPSSAQHIQSVGDAWRGFLDRGAVTLFEMDSGELSTFLSQITVNSRSGPAKSGPGDPCVGGWNVWPVGSPTACPGNPEYSGFTSTWSGATIPLEMMSCESPVGDSLHIEVWAVAPTGLVIKLCTDWN